MSARSSWHPFSSPCPSVSFPAAPQPTLLQPTSMLHHSCFPFFHNVPPGPLSIFLNSCEASHTVCFILQISLLFLGLLLFPAAALDPESSQLLSTLSEASLISPIVPVCSWGLPLFTCRLWPIATFLQLLSKDHSSSNDFLRALEI